MGRLFHVGRVVLPFGVLLAAALAMPAAAQMQSPIVIPPAPTIVASPPGSSGPAPDSSDATQTAPLTPPPGLTQTPVPPPTPIVTPGATANTDTGAAGVAPVAPPTDSWDPATAARLGVLNVVDGSVSEVVIPVGGQASIGDLKVSVAACLRRPPGQVPDAAAFIDVQADAAGAPPPVAAANAPLDAPPESAAAESDDASDEGQTPASQSPDAQSGPPAYRGWMVRSMPAAMVVGDASETLRVIDCS